MTIGKRLTDLRNARKLDQEDVAKKLGVARSTYANWERDYREPDVANFVKLAEIFHVPVGFLITGEYEDSNLDATDRELLNEYHRFAKEDQEYYLGLFRRLPKER